MTDTLNSARGEEDADEDEGEEEGGDYGDDAGGRERQKKERDRDRDSAVGFRLDDVRRSLEYECKEEEDAHHKNIRNLTDTAPKVPSTSQIDAAVSERHFDIFILQDCL